MNKISAYMRMTGATITDADVDSRTAATSSLAAAWCKIKGITKLVQKAGEVAAALNGDGTPPAALALEVQQVIQDTSSSFQSDERPLEVGMCAGLAMMDIVGQEPGTTGWLIADVYATALWLALSYQPQLETQPKREALRIEVLEAARKRSLEGAEKARLRIDVSDPADVAVTVDEDSKGTVPLKKAMASTVDALRRNAALDREELDFLWWSLLGRSRLLNKQLAAIAEPTRIVAAGIEAAGQLRRFPCNVHREIVLRTLDADPEVTLSDLLAAIGEDRQKLIVTSGANFVEEYPAVFPLLEAIRTGEVPPTAPPIARRVSEWGVRALLEAGFAKILADGPSSL